MKISFRKQPQPTGLAAVGHPYPATEIKVDRKVVGHITPPNWQTEGHDWGVSIAVKREPTPDSPCPWRWVRFKRRFPSEPDARQFVVDKLAWALEKHRFELYAFEEDAP